MIASAKCLIQDLQWSFPTILCVHRTIAHSHTSSSHFQEISWLTVLGNNCNLITGKLPAIIFIYSTTRKEQELNMNGYTASNSRVLALRK